MRISDWSSDVCSSDLFDGSVRPVDGLNLTLAMTWLNPKYDSFVGSAFGDISGTKPASIPDLSASMGATYTHRFAGDSRAIFHVDYLYESPTRMVDGLQGFPAGFSDQFKRKIGRANV